MDRLAVTLRSYLVRYPNSNFIYAYEGCPNCKQYPVSFRKVGSTFFSSLGRHYLVHSRCCSLGYYTTAFGESLVPIEYTQFLIPIALDYE